MGGPKDYCSVLNGRHKTPNNNVRGAGVSTSMSLSNHITTKISNRRLKKKSPKMNGVSSEKQRKVKPSVTRGYQNGQRKRYSHPPPRRGLDGPHPPRSFPDRMVGLYLDSQRILVVGDGDFSFSRSLAEGFS